MKTEIEMTPIVCITCGIIYGIPTDYHNYLKKKHTTYYCPNQHGQFIPAETDEDKLKKQLKEKEETEINLRNQIEKLESKRKKR
jgi:hypothetical protein